MSKCQSRTWLQSPRGQRYLTSGKFTNSLGLSLLTCKMGTIEQICRFAVIYYYCMWVNEHVNNNDQN